MTTAIPSPVPAQALPQRGAGKSYAALDPTDSWTALGRILTEDVLPETYPAR